MWVSVARADKPPVELEWRLRLNAPAEAGPYGFSEEEVRMNAFLGGHLDRGRDESTTVDDGWFRTTCRLADRRLHLTLAGRPSHWPEHLPEETTCAVGRYRVRVLFQEVAPLYAAPEAVWIREGTAFPLRLYAGEPGERSSRSLAIGLAPEVPWVDASAFLQAAGQRWGDGVCQVRAGDRPLLRVAYTTEMAGEGSCEVVDGAGATHRFDFRREDVPVVPSADAAPVPPL